MADRTIGNIGVAISTTGDPHRLGFLETAVQRWINVLTMGDRLIVTVDGDLEAVARVQKAVGPRWVYRVGQSARLPADAQQTRDGRLGVAVNKNTGIELLMEQSTAAHLFLSDDDAWPIHREALDEHIRLSAPHSMVCWGRHRVGLSREDYTSWSWPRGSVLYVRRSVVEQIGGMIEAFGPGGHEHVEWSRRIHQAGLTPAMFLSPASHSTARAMGAAAHWHCEDMPRPGEPMGNHKLRRRRLTSVRREDGDWEQIDSLMKKQDGCTDFVPYTAAANGRQSATLYHSKARA